MLYNIQKNLLLKRLSNAKKVAKQKEIKVKEALKKQMELEKIQKKIERASRLKLSKSQIRFLKAQREKKRQEYMKAKEKAKKLVSAAGTMAKKSYNALQAFQKWRVGNYKRRKSRGR